VATSWKRKLLALIGTSFVGWILSLGFGAIFGGVVALYGHAHKGGIRWLLPLAIGVGLVAFAAVLAAFHAFLEPWLTSRQVEKPLSPLRILADTADMLSAEIFRFENRNPDGNPLSPPALGDLLGNLGAQPNLSDRWSQFEALHGLELRNLYHDLREVSLASPLEQDLFYHPRSVDDRLRVAFRLHDMARAARDRS
jgi:hypothetical protein